MALPIISLLYSCRLVFAPQTFVENEGEGNSDTDRSNEMPRLPLAVTSVDLVDGNTHQGGGYSVPNLGADQIKMY